VAYVLPSNASSHVFRALSTCLLPDSISQPACSSGPAPSSDCGHDAGQATYMVVTHHDNGKAALASSICMSGADLGNMHAAAQLSSPVSSPGARTTFVVLSASDMTLQLGMHQTPVG
jgi:hypothetical protein